MAAEGQNDPDTLSNSEGPHESPHHYRWQAMRRYLNRTQAVLMSLENVASDNEGDDDDFSLLAGAPATNGPGRTPGTLEWIIDPNLDLASIEYDGGVQHLAEAVQTMAALMQVMRSQITNLQNELTLRAEDAALASQQVDINTKNNSLRIQVMQTKVTQLIASMRAHTGPSTVVPLARVGVATTRPQTPIEPGDDSDLLSEAESNATLLTSTLKVAPLTTTEAQKLVLDMSPNSIKTTLPEFEEVMRNRGEIFDRLLDMTREAWAKACVTDPVCKEADRIFARYLMQVIGSTGTYVKVWKMNEKELLLKDRKAARSGKELIERVRASVALTARREITAHITHIKDTVYIRAGMTEMQVKAGAAQLYDDWERLPAKEQETRKLQDLLLKKIPSEVKEDATRTYAERLQDELQEYEVKHGDGKMRYSWKELVDLIAARIGSASAKGNIRVNTKRGVENCFNCGSAACEAGWKKCTKRGLCGTAGCTCIFAGRNKCFVRSGTQPKPLGEMKNGAGKQMHERTYKTLLDAKKDYDRSVRKSANAMRDAAEEEAEDEDDGEEEEEDEAPRTPAKGTAMRGGKGAKGGIRLTRGDMCWR